MRIGFWWGNVKERPGCRWETNIKMGHEAVGWEVVDRIVLAHVVFRV